MPAITSSQPSTITVPLKLQNAQGGFADVELLIPNQYNPWAGLLCEVTCSVHLPFGKIQNSVMSAVQILAKDQDGYLISDGSNVVFVNKSVVQFIRPVGVAAAPKSQ